MKKRIFITDRSRKRGWIMAGVAFLILLSSWSTMPARSAEPEIPLLTAPETETPLLVAPEQLTGTLAGSVKSETGEALGAVIEIAGAEIPALNADPKTGAFLGRLKPGKYRVTVKLDGYLPQEQKVEIRGGKVTRVDFKLKPVAVKAPPVAEPKTGTLAGLVKSEAGEALGATIEFAEGKIPALQADPQTGAYQGELMPGKYRVMVKLDGYQPLESKINIKAGEETQADFKLKPVAVKAPPVAEPKTGTLAGSVKSEKGEALGAVIEFAGGVTQALKADPKTGAFQGKVDSGQYQVTVRLDGYLPLEKKVTIKGGKETRVDFKLKAEPPKTGTLAGSVKSEKREALGAVIEFAGGKIPALNADPKSGAFKGELKPGQYQVTVRLDGYLPLEKKVTIKGGKETRVDFKLKAEPPKTGTLAGSVKSEKGEALGAVIEFAGGVTSALKADPKTGAFQGKIELGQYQVTVKLEGYLPLEKKIKVRGGEETRVDFKLKAVPPKTGTLNGSVTSEAGEALGAVIEFAGAVTGALKADPKTGAFQGKVDTGEYQVTVKLEGYLLQEKKVTINPGQETRVDFKLVPLMGTLAGTVKSEAGEALGAVIEFAGAVVPALKSDPKTGAFLGRLKPGKYQVNIKLDGYLPQEQQVGIEGNKVTRVDSKLVPKKGTLAGSVISETGEALGAVIEFAGGVTQALKADLKTGTFQGKVAMGQYLVIIKLDGYLLQEKKVTINPGQETRVDFKLVPKTGTLAGSVISETGEALGAVIEFAGAVTGALKADLKTGTFQGKVASGEYQVTVKLDGYLLQEKKVTINPGQENRVDFKLVPLMGTLAGMVKSEAGGALGAVIEFAGAVVPALKSDPKTGAFLGKMKPGKYQVMVKLDGYLPQEQQVGIEGNKVTRVDFKLVPKKGTLAGSVKSEAGEALGAVIEFAGGVTQALKADLKTGTFQGKVAMGQYLVIIKLDGYLPQEQKVVIEGMKETKIDFRLKEDEKWLAMIKALLEEASGDFAAGRFGAARKKVERILEMKPKSAEAFLLLGQVNYQEKDLVAAKHNLSQSLILNPGQARVHYYLGLVFQALGNGQLAVAEFEKAIELDPNHEAAHLQLGMVYQQQNQIPLAEQEFNTVLNVNPQNIEAKKYLSEIYFSQGRLALTKEDYLKARDSFIKSLEKNPANDQARYFLAQTFLKIPHFIEAKDLLNQYLSANPNSTEAKEALDRITKTWSAEAAPPVPAPPAPGPAPKAEIKSVAVSSFENRSGDKQYDWLKVGIAESLSTDLSKFNYLRVAERRQVEEILKEKRLKQLGVTGGDSEPGADLYEEVAKSLATQGVIFGGYQVVGGVLRIDARLVDVGSGEVINAVSVEGKLADIFGLERKLALGLIRNFIPVTPQEVASVQGGETKDLEAFRKFSQGMSLFYLGENQAAQKMYQEALKTDPRYSEALRELALTRKDVSKADTLAILPFQNATGQVNFDWLKIGIAESLTTDLKKATGIFLVERMKIEAALKEMRLGQVLGVEQAAQVGKQVGAGVVLIGSFQMLGDQIRVDSRMVEVESGQILMSEKVNGTVDAIFKVEEDLALKIADTLKVKLSPEEMALIKQKPDLESFKRYIQAHSVLQIAESKPSEQEGKKVEIRTIAVTEFENTSGDQRFAWVGGGIQNALSTDLKQKGNFNMIERSEIGKVVREQEQKLSKIGVTKEDLAAKVGQAVGADAVIAGDFQTVGDTVRINSRLVNVATGEILLAERVDGKTEAIFQLQNQLAEKMLKVLGGAREGKTSGTSEGQGTELSQSPYAALGSSLLLPGSGQIFVNKKPGRGLVIFGTEVVLVGAALAFHMMSNTNYNDYLQKVNANDPAAQKKYDQAQTDVNTRNYLLIGVGAVAIFSAADSFIMSLRSGKPAPAASVKAESNPKPDRTSMKKWNFDMQDTGRGIAVKLNHRF